ncbi:uncharacterized protein LOC109811496 [Cajanus cajan]|uniref:uncharacterized protein LOC109811496 n=1 Tax=Cajanus cajan TaxID=3821 RepID=UPI00098D8AA3|nr:uncharacterized protein LOC109811496 [Cajanus cajan]
MSIPPNSPARGCAANFPQPVGQNEMVAANDLVNLLQRINLQEAGLEEVVYRPSDLEYDIRRPLVRWDTRPYQDIFVNGFQARPRGDTPNTTYYNLDHFVHNAGAPLDPTRRATHTFVSTTLNYDWYPNPTVSTLPRGHVMQFFRYEIYAPGGIWVGVTLRGRYNHVSQAEVCFAAGIAPQYIRSCIVYTAIRDVDSNHVSFVREIKLIINGHFNPQAHPYAEVIIYLPIHTYEDENGVERYLPEETYPPRNSSSRYKREISESDDNNNDAAHEWYTHKVIDVPSYINSAFRASSNNEAYLFMKNKYVLVNYAPGSTDDRIVNGPLRICDGFPSLIDTPFGEYGIDCAFDTDYNEAFIFCANLCALIDYAPGTTNDKILSGPMPIASMFPFFKGTVFENGIDAAFKATSNYEAYLFRHEKYALVNYNSKTLIAIRNITDGFPSLMGTVFASDIDAAFASHRTDEAYIFKGELYALINFAPATTDDYIVGTRIKEILPNWPSLRDVLPLMNRGLDFHHHGHGQDHHSDHRDDEF